MKRLVPVFLALTLLGTLLTPAIVRAQAYRWVDDEGRVHYSQGFYSIPSKYRPKAQQVDSSPSPPSTPEKVEAEKKPPAAGKPGESPPAGQSAPPAEPEKKEPSG